MAAKLLPIKDRIVRSSMVSQPFVPGFTRPLKYKNWDDAQLELACTAIKEEGMSLRRAAEEYKIPKSTIQDHVSGKVLMGSKSGQRYLTDEEEEELLAFILGSAKIGYPHTRKQVISLVQGVLDEKGRGVIVSSGWWEGFKKRHPEISLRAAEQLAYVRASHCSAEALSNYFDLLEQTLEENGLLSNPSQLFNCDETGMPLDPKPPKVVVRKGTKHPRTVTTGNKTQITVLACCNAAGSVIPPFVIYDRKCLKPEMYEGEVYGTMYGLSDSGWVNSELFELWFFHHFLPHAPSSRPLLLLLDGHSSHYNPSVIKKAAEEKVIIFCLPPHSSHETQPLDKGPFGPLKSTWKEVCQKFLHENPGKVVTRFSFSKLFNEAWTSSMNMRNVQAGFRCTGIYPLNRDIFKPSKPDKSGLAERTGIKFIPLYSPVRHRRSTEVVSSEVNFTEEEEIKFQKRYEEGFDIQSDERYNLWKKKNHSSSNGSLHLSFSDHDPIDIDSCNTTNPIPSCLDNATSSHSDLSYCTPAVMDPVEINAPIHVYPNETNFSLPNFPFYTHDLHYQAGIPFIGSQYQLHPYSIPFPFYKEYTDSHLATDLRGGFSDPFLFYNKIHCEQYGGNKEANMSSLPKTTVLSKVLQKGPQMKLPSIPPKKSGKVLTSAENLIAITEKERLKEEKERQKKERQEKRDKAKSAKLKKCGQGNVHVDSVVSRCKPRPKKVASTDDDTTHTENSNGGQENVDVRRKPGRTKKVTEHIDDILDDAKNFKGDNPDIQCQISRADVNQDIYCVCKKREHGKMIYCDGDECPIGWWHYKCANIKRKPKGDWFCCYCNSD